MKTNKGLEFFSQNSGKKPPFFISVVIVAFILIINGCTKEQIDKSPADLTGPEITSVSPANNSTIAVSSTPEATFNEKIDETTLSSAFIVRNGNNVIPGTVSYAEMKATFIPSVSFQPSTLYTCTITTALQDVSGNYLETDYIWSFTTGPAPDVQAPSVLSVTPANNSTSVLTNSTISVIFSEAINVQTISISSFFLKQGNNLIPGTVSYSGNAAIFTPSSALQNGTVYSATVTTSVKDVAGNALGSNYSWEFTTAATVDNIPPTVLFVSPASNATGVATNTKPSVTFSEPISQSSFTSSSFTVKQGSTLVPGTISWSGNTATFNPSAAFLTGSSYTCTITTVVKDVAGNSLASNYTWTFSTAAATDNVAPTVLSVNPASNATGVATSIKPSVTFSEPMSQSSVSSSSFTLKQGSSTITGAISWSGNTATFTPTAALLPGTSYSCTITTAVKDVAGNSLATNYSWTFTTASAGKSFSADVVPILNLCNSCHNHSWTPSSNPSTFHANLVNSGHIDLTTPTNGKIYKKVNSGHPSSGVPADKKNILITWILEGSKNN
ncbi:MAG TPA: Ig-like domain-containing protein [Bacteroidales bacterium]|nr:Ig-like domain-containing protein [Bacteroidales bacterium]